MIQDDQNLVKLCLSNTYHIFWIIKCTKILEGVFRGKKYCTHISSVNSQILNKMSVQYAVCVYEVCSKKDRTFAIKTLLLILQHFKHCPPQSSPLCWQYTVPNISSIFGMPPGTHFL